MRTRNEIYADGQMIAEFESWNACRMEAQARSEANPNVKYVCCPNQSPGRKSVAFLNGNKMRRIVDADGCVLWTPAAHPKHF